MLWADRMGALIKGARILLIDDSKPFQRITVATLTKMGVASVEVASSLQEGMGILNYSDTSPLNHSFDLVLFDISLPDGNGIDGCRFLTLHRMTRDIPVVVISGQSSAETIRRAFAAGASDFLQKPLDAQLLRVRLGALMGLNDCAWGGAQSWVL